MHPECGTVSSVELSPMHKTLVVAFFYFVALSFFFKSELLQNYVHHISYFGM